MNVVRLSALRTSRLYLPGDIPGTHFCYRLSRTSGNSAAGSINQWKVPMTLSGIEPVTFQLVVQCLNQLCYYVPPKAAYSSKMLMLVFERTWCQNSGVLCGQYLLWNAKNLYQRKITCCSIKFSFISSVLLSNIDFKSTLFICQLDCNGMSWVNSPHL
jgi:hypothetical protein